MEEKEDIYYVKIPNNKRFKGVYVNEKVRLENKIVDEDVSSIKTEVESRLFEVKQLNIDIEVKKYLARRELEIFRLKRELNELIDIKIKLALITGELEQLKRDMLVTEDDINENIDEDLLD